MTAEPGVLVDIGHPAHVHVYKNVRRLLLDRGVDVYVTAREKDRSLGLLSANGIPYEEIGGHRTGSIPKGLHSVERIRGIHRALRQHNLGVAMGVHNPYVAIAGTLARVPSVVLIDSEPVQYDRYLTYPFASYLLTPRRFSHDLGRKHIRFDGFKELAYLHPKYFSPDAKILERLDLTPADRFYIVRFVAWAAEHDIGQRGLSLDQKRRLVAALAHHGRVFISSEAPLPGDLTPYRLRIPPDRIHDVLAYASLLVSESQTMTTEAAILGTPAVQTNTLVGTMSNFFELEHRYSLIRAEADGEKALALSEELACNPGSKEEAQNRSKALLQDKIDVAEYLTDAAMRVLRGQAPLEGTKER